MLHPAPEESAVREQFMAPYRGQQVIVSHLRDLTEQLTMEAELERQREIVHQSEKLSALGEPLAGVAHALNNPLSVVVGQRVRITVQLIEAESGSRV